MCPAAWRDLVEISQKCFSALFSVSAWQVGSVSVCHSLLTFTGQLGRLSSYVRQLQLPFLTSIPLKWSDFPSIAGILDLFCKLSRWLMAIPVFRKKDRAMDENTVQMKFENVELFPAPVSHLQNLLSWYNGFLRNLKAAKI